MTRGQNGGQNERLRALLAEARKELYFLGESFAEALAAGCGGSAERYARDARHFHARIDAALAEPAEGCLQCYALGELRVIDQRKNGEAQAEIRNVYAELRATRAEVERLTRQVDIQEAFKKIAQQERDQAEAQRNNTYRRGAEAMREAAARECWSISDEMASVGGMLSEQGTAQIAATKIRALPIPEDKP